MVNPFAPATIDKKTLNSKNLNTVNSGNYVDEEDSESFEEDFKRGNTNKPKSKISKIILFLIL
jgi:hypothetical protein